MTATSVSLSDANVAEFDPAGDGTSTITIVVSNAGGSDQYSFNVTFDVLQAASITWPSENFDVGDGRYEFVTGTSATAVPLGTLLPTVSSASGHCRCGDFQCFWHFGLGCCYGLLLGLCRCLPGSAAADRTYEGQLVVSVAATASVRAATFTRPIQITVSSAAVPCCSA